MRREMRCVLFETRLIVSEPISVKWFYSNDLSFYYQHCPDEGSQERYSPLVRSLTTLTHSHVKKNSSLMLFLILFTSIVQTANFRYIFLSKSVSRMLILYFWLNLPKMFLLTLAILTALGLNLYHNIITWFSLFSLILYWYTAFEVTHNISSEIHPRSPDTITVRFNDKLVFEISSFILL